MVQLKKKPTLRQEAAKPATSHKLWVKWVFCAIPLFTAGLMYFFLPFFPKFTEYIISRGLFRIIGIPTQWIMSVFPFSVTEMIVLLSAPVLLTLAVIWIIRIVKSSNKKQTAERGIRFVSWCLSLAALLFMIMHGANYSRLSTAELLGLPSRAYTANDLYLLTADLAKKASAAREKLPEDENGCVVLTTSKSEFLLAADNCYDNLQKTCPFLKTGVWRVKSVMLSHYWSYTGITGVYCPWTGESNINTDTPQSGWGHTAAHELAHTMGFAREDDCNFLGWLACSVSGNPDYEYSGHLAAYIYCSNALYSADRELWKKAKQNCSDGMVRDMRQKNAYWQSFEGDVMETSESFNDSFIKANGDQNGILSYSHVVELLLRYYDSKNMLS